MKLPFGEFYILTSILYYKKPIKASLGVKTVCKFYSARGVDIKQPKRADLRLGCFCSVSAIT